MNTALNNATSEKYGIPGKTVSPFLDPMPKTIDPVEEKKLFHVLELADHLPVSSPIPEKRNPVMDVDKLVVPCALMRRIEHELRHGECDVRTVFNYCRGLERGTRAFEEAYIIARIRSFARHQRQYSDPAMDRQFNLNTLTQSQIRASLARNIPPPPHPMAVNHLGHLMSHYGIWVIALIGIQAWASWRIGAIANTYLEGGRMFYSAVALCLILALDSVLWFRRRGNLCDAFLVPGAVLFVVSVLPIFILHIREVLLATR